MEAAQTASTTRTRLSNGKRARVSAPVVPLAINISNITDSNNNAGCSLEYDPCVDSRTDVYLNRADVQKAIHVVPAFTPGGTWESCSSIVNYSYTDLLTSMLPVYDYLMQNWPQGRYLVFSGDVDAIVPFTGTRLWLSALNLPIKAGADFHPYNTPDQQVAGWSWTYAGPNNSNLHFASVRNAGHLAPALQGSRTLQMFATFLSGADL